MRVLSTLHGFSVPPSVLLVSYTLAGGLAGLVVGAVIHEGAHVMIFNRYGCDYRVALPLQSGLWIAVYPDCPSDTAAVAQRATVVAESVGYHLYLLLGVAGGVLGLRGYRGGANAR